ncbi:MAG: ABC transporter ATP-binding protein [Clostridiales bacterium]|nr:ABC transporter ATP-binding protein [Clostridiales bacterium]
MANLQLKSVSKIYPSGELALYKNNLQLSDSEFIAVVGGEKCGKTTLLRLIAGLDEVTEGTILIGDKDVTGEPSKDRDIAMIFQGNTLFPAVNVYENIAYGLRLRKTSNTVIEQRVKAAAELLGLTDVLYRKPKALTTEQKQRAVFGRAIAREPKLYLLDDPLSGLDKAMREKLRSVLINLQVRMNGTFVYATKNVNEALTMATRIVVLREGFIQQIDTPANLYDYPANAFVAFTVGSPTINFVNGATIEREGTAVYAVYGDVRWQLPENITARFASLDAYAGTGKKVILGLRPEDMSVGESGFMQATVSAAEEIAGCAYADCDGNAGKLSFVVRADGVNKGDTVNLTADMTHAYLFDAETRLTLLERDAGYEKTDYPDADVTPLAFEEEETLKKKFSLPKAEPKKKK